MPETLADTPPEREEGPVAEKQLAIRIPEELHRRFRLECVRRGVSMRDVLEEAIRKFLAGKRGR
ncbi:MAG: hypothetical protein HYZ11_08305 [Candidatus Tectomicrobia bacterium]|uniref:Toxin-antitoxin system HicB family antitoxin n=1 Tax=Tectimicrobiota bacterium TaxID=2528274 RepID=A0A932HXM6_UNCTE|nr:hypothetical protein [Candidatus Tectomicrobia bacterium]